MYINLDKRLSLNVCKITDVMFFQLILA